MNKAAFLSILHHVSAITDQEISELEQLALNFPYCQSAHLLLAKAAYDRGSMLSNQKLRRAAACATNRQLLKKLIYTSATDLLVAPIAPLEDDISLASSSEAEVKSAVELPSPASLPEAIHYINNPAEPNLIDIQEPASELNATLIPEEQLQSVSEPLLSEPTAIEVKEPDQHEETQPQVEDTPPEDILVEEYLSGEILPEESIPEESILEEFTPEEITASEVVLEKDNLREKEINQEKNDPVQIQPETVLNFSDEDDALFTVEQLNPALPLIDPVTAFITHDMLTAITAEDVESGIIDQEKEIEVDLPVSDFEATASDLNTAVDLVLADELISRQDPIDADEQTVNSTLQDVTEVDLKDEETLSRFDEYLFTPEKETEPTEINSSLPDYQEEIIYKVFDANELGYWMDSSRLGETLLLKNELATAQPFHFSPELFLEYSKHHELTSYEAPPVSVLTRQLDIIDQFLKLNPKLKSMSNLKLRPEPQEDLSSRSTKIKKNLASENLANILVQQGKIKKAIKIYEHLILKIPEKKAYFASQIEKLQMLS